MSPAVWFWLIYVISIIFGVWGEFAPVPGNPYIRRAWYVVLYILIGLLGYKTFGSPVR